MNIFSDVSETAIITLRARTIETQKHTPVIRDDVSLFCLEKIRLLLPEETRMRLLDNKMSRTLSSYIALRALKYDSYVREFLTNYPDGLVVSLGSGFDTRYWRISDKAWKYIEVDLPNVIEAKKEILQERMTYRTIEGSVLEDQWITDILAIQNQHILFLAEGLFMYLPQKQVEGLFKKLSDSFLNSGIVFETVNKKYTQGLWKKSVESKMKRSAGTTAGASYQFGLKSAKEIESFGKNIKVVEEWSYFEDADVEPKVLWHFRNLKFFTRTQWTIKATIG